MDRILLIAALCGVTYGAAINEGRIVGGNHINIQDVPYQVSIFFLHEHLCGGAILNSNFVLTAGHCIRRINKSSLDVRTGVANIEDAEYAPRYPVSEIIAHPNFALTPPEGVRNDIALLRLSTPIQLNQYALPIRIASHEPNPGSLVTITGYGSTGEHQANNGELLVVSVPVVDRFNCSRTYSKYGISYINEEFFCAGYKVGKKDACQGDSGGPVVYNGQLVGIVSFGIGCGRPSIPGVYSNVANYYSWIQDNMA